jgi:hypothetical protein
MNNSKIILAAYNTDNMGKLFPAARGRLPLKRDRLSLSRHNMSGLNARPSLLPGRYKQAHAGLPINLTFRRKRLKFTKQLIINIIKRISYGKSY